jgi:hypothetical protein
MYVINVILVNYCNTYLQIVYIKSKENRLYKILLNILKVNIATESQHEKKTYFLFH